jgi:hypothetical protein
MQARNGRNGAPACDSGSPDTRNLRYKKRWFRIFEKNYTVARPAIRKPFVLTILSSAVIIFSK